MRIPHLGNIRATVRRTSRSSLTVTADKYRKDVAGRRYRSFSVHPTHVVVLSLPRIKRWRRPDHQKSYDYVRRAYNVPAYVGLRIRYGGKPGRIVKPGKSTPYVHVRMDSEPRPFTLHPCESSLEYLAPSGRVMDAWHRHCANRGRLPGKCHCPAWGDVCEPMGQQRAAEAFRVVFPSAA